MSSSAGAKAVRFDEDSMWVELSDGRTLGVPLAWFPRLLHGSAEQRGQVGISSRGLHWEALDEDISIAGLLAGRGDQTRPQAAMKPASTMATGTSPGTIKVMKEDLVVGKREVEAGGMRVTSKVVETPVQEQVTLHEERVSIERRPVNERVSGTEAFRDQTIEARATAEEAVVGKDVRVVEEIGLKKEAADRTETVRDTVRETKVDVENVATTATTTGTTSVTGSTGTSTTKPMPGV